MNLLTALACGLFLAASLGAQAAPEGLDNDTCFACHGVEGFSAPGKDGKERSLFVDKKMFDKTVHAPRDCVNCHTYITKVPHELDPKFTGDAAKLAILKNCGGCHGDNLKSYKDTYHGQVTTLGYAYTAKCFDCHAADRMHDIKRVKDPESTVHPNNRLKTCQTCHTNATPGFVTFQPHGHAHDLNRYPHIWVASKFMIGLLAGTFAFFWLHSALWFYREAKDRKEGKARPHIMLEAVPPGAEGKHFQRFHWGWRLAHLVFALMLMTLTLTGMTVMYADSAWAPIVSKLLGGPKGTAIIHRVCAVIFAAIFFGHLVYVVRYLWINRKTFKVFGPYSLIPGPQDLWDVIAMFKWFFGRAPRPVFDRYTYWERFDYWAPFWGVTIIGTSGLMLWFPEVTATYLPGWVFNVAMIAHGEEAFLAAVFLFTVHFFNNHYRPEKFPLDTVMFTGSMSLEEYARDHTLEYRRLVANGELQKYLVDPPSAPMTRGSRILGFTLIGIGITLLFLVFAGFVS